MDSKYILIADQMLENYDVLKKSFRWEQDISKWLNALAYATHKKDLNPDEIKAVMEHAKKETSMFSPFRAYSLFPICGLLNLNNDRPNDVFDNMNSNFDLMKRAGFKQTTYLPVALYTLSMVYHGPDYTGYAEKKAMDVYKEMRSNHPFLTGGDDYALAILLANEQGKLDRIEEYYQELKSAGFSVSNGLQMMSHILTFSDSSVGSVVKMCVEIEKTLKSNKLKVYSDYYPAIAIMALIGSANYTEELIEVAKYLKKNKKNNQSGLGKV